jgi:hypothetical protein
MVVPAPPEPTEIVGDFSAFYRRELSGQVRRATLLVGDPEVARDLVHDAFADVYTRWATLREAGPTTSMSPCSTAAVTMLAVPAAPASGCGCAAETWLSVGPAGALPSGLVSAASGCLLSPLTNPLGPRRRTLCAPEWLSSR